MDAPTEVFAPELNTLYDVSLQAYLEGPGLSKTDTDDIEDCPLEFKRGGDEQTDAMAMGSLIHCLALEPDRFSDRYVLEPSLEGRTTKAGKPAASPRSTESYKEDVSALEAEYPCHEVLFRDDLEHARALAKAIRSSGVFENLLGGSPLCERSIWFEEMVYDEGKDERVPVLLKARPDAHRERPNDIICVDLKKTRNAGPKKFGRDSALYRYHVSAWMTSAALAAVYHKPVVWIAFVVEPKPPYKVAYYRYGSTPQAIGQVVAHRNLTTWLACEKADNWPGYNGGKIADIEIPYWLSKEVMDDQAASNPEPF